MFICLEEVILVQWLCDASDSERDSRSTLLAI